MNKTGRNDPCPCGSGKKYKKCCLRDDERKAREVHAPEPNPERLEEAWAPPVSPATGREDSAIPLGPNFLSPYTIARLVEGEIVSELADDGFRARLRKRFKDRWTISRVSRMTTEEIVGQLEKFGVHFSAERFLRQAEGRRSAWEISRLWIIENKVRCGRFDVDFLGLAACELWKRLCPERPSMEMLDDWMQEGYGLVKQGRGQEACERWWQTWQALRESFSPAMNKIEDTGAVFSGTQSIFNWCQDFEHELSNLAREHRPYAKMGRRYCEEFLAQFTAEEAFFQVAFRRSLADFLCELQMPDAALKLLLENVARWPEEVWGYIALADAYGHSFYRDHGLALDLAEANRWLDRALSHGRLDPGDREIVEQRKASLREQEDAARESA